ncbi:hypothetical protein NP603_12580, partial [Methylomonas sp. SURF-1]
PCRQAAYRHGRSDYATLSAGFAVTVQTPELFRPDVLATSVAAGKPRPIRPASRTSTSCGACAAKFAA